MKKIMMKGIVLFSALVLSPLTVLGGVSVTYPAGVGIQIDDGHHRHHRHHGERVCKEVTREKCKQKCHWSEYHRQERCRTFCKPVTEKKCWNR